MIRISFYPSNNYYFTLRHLYKLTLTKLQLPLLQPHGQKKSEIVFQVVSSNNQNVIWKQNIESEIESNSIFNIVTECKM